MKVVVIDDHELFRLGVRDFLAASPEYEIVGEAGNARGGLQVIESTRPDIVLLDSVLPGMDGILAAREILRRMPETRIIIVSGHDQLGDLLNAMSAGALGYVRKGDAPTTLLDALERVARGVRYVAPSLAARMSALGTRSPRDGLLAMLSARERQVFRLAAECRTPREIAEQLHLARKTVDTHVSRIYRKLGLRDRAELVRLAASAGLLRSLAEPEPAPEPSNGVGPPVRGG